jgi:GDP-L-fucose synthase
MPQTHQRETAFIRRFHEAKLANAASVAIWGIGTPRREFLYADFLSGTPTGLAKQN